MALDIDGDVAAILGSGTDLPRVAVTYTAAKTATTDSVTGVLIERNREFLDDARGVASNTAIFLVDKDEFSSVTVWGEGDTVAPTVSSEVVWKVMRCRERQEHLTLDLEKTTSAGRL